MQLLARATAALSSLRWRTVALSLLALTLLHLLFIDDTLRNAYTSRVATTSKELIIDSPPASAPSDAPPPVSPPDSSPPPPFPTPTSIPPFDAGDTTESIALCLAIKDQYADLTEWLTHHYHHLSIRRFYIMDDGSSPPLATRDFAPFLDPRAITHRYYHPATRVPNMQLSVYDDCVRLFGHRHKWIGFLDADEFLEVRGNKTFQEILGEYDDDETVGAFAVNWVIHSSSGLLTRPASARKSFVTCIADPSPDHSVDFGIDNEHVKVFVKPALYAAPGNPHMMKLQAGARTVGEKGDTVDRMAWRVPITRETVALHHYATKSREEYQQKIDRSNGMGMAKGWDWWSWIEGRNSSVCREMTGYEP